MKKYILIMAFTVGFAVFAQENTYLEIDKSDNQPAKEFWENIKGHCSKSFSVGFCNANFFNTLYYNNKESGIINSKVGFWATYSWMPTPFMFDFSFFYQGIEVNSSNFYPTAQETSCNFRGVSVFASFSPLLPDLGEFSKYVRPYLGVGLQSSGIKAQEKVVDGTKTTYPTIGAYGTAGMMWKTGVDLVFGKGIKYGIRTEYHQSISLKVPEAFNLFQIGFFWGGI